MIITKTFTRFIVNNEKHEFPNKIKASKVQIKEYERDEKTNMESFICDKFPRLSAGSNQFMVDMKGNVLKKYFPLRYYKYDPIKNIIIKKTDIEIREMNKNMKIQRRKIRSERQGKENELLKTKNIMTDNTKSDKERLEAAIKIISEEVK